MQVRVSGCSVPSTVLNHECLHHLHKQLFRLRPSSLFLVGRCQVVHGGQGVRMLRPEYCLVCLHHLHFQLFRLRPSFLIPKCRCQLVHAGQGGRVLRPEYCFSCLHH